MSETSIKTCGNCHHFKVRISADIGRCAGPDPLKRFWVKLNRQYRPDYVISEIKTRSGTIYHVERVRIRDRAIFAQAISCAAYDPEKDLP